MAQNRANRAPVLAESHSHVGDDAILHTKYPAKFQDIDTSHVLVQSYVGEYHLLIGRLITYKALEDTGISTDLYPSSALLQSHLAPQYA
jgi:hypothetical protein